MLELHHVTKEYRDKHGAPVRALNDVSLSFGERGLVFLLGKSGSGKSTLLHVAGGLDRPTSGEIVVRGRHSADFSGGDFDGYRNTCVGFVFQEYNVLDEFTVEDNIALATELQGRAKEEEKIGALLDRLGLRELAARRPNTLSGGQKQRVAIARALVKDPDILMADEPTGALDSTTAAQIFDILKDLSKEKLVLVVSHDREFAERYADRIIELADGKVLSDTERGTGEDAADDILRIPEGEMTEEDDRRALAFLHRQKKGAVLLSAERAAEVRTVGSGAHAGFVPTGEQVATRTYTAEESRFIRSKLPLRHAFRIGVSGLRFKPVRLIATILLCTIAFSMFGLFSSMIFFDERSSLVASLASSDQNYLVAERQYLQFIEYGYIGEEYDRNSYAEHGYLSAADLEAFGRAAGSAAIGLTSVHLTEQGVLEDDNDLYHKNSVTRVTAMTDNPLVTAMPLVGRYPQAAGEVTLPRFLAESIYVLGLYAGEDGERTSLGSADDLIGKPLSFMTSYYSEEPVTLTVVGIYDSGMPEAKFDPLKHVMDDDKPLTREEYREIYALNEAYESALYDGLYQTILVDESLVRTLGTPLAEIYDYPDEGDYHYRVYRNYVRGENDIYDLMMAPNRGKTASVRAAVALHGELNEQDSFLSLTGPVVEAVLSISSLAEELSSVFLWIGVVTAIFSALLLSNFISVSVSQKKREIGILRAVGARSFDVFRIFSMESATITAACAVFGCVVSSLLCGAFNREAADLLTGTKLLVFGPLSIGVIVLIAAVCALLATAVPVYMVARKPPVTAIRAL